MREFRCFYLTLRPAWTSGHKAIEIASKCFLKVILELMSFDELCNMQDTAQACFAATKAVVFIWFYETFSFCFRSESWLLLQRHSSTHAHTQTYTPRTHHTDRHTHPQKHSHLTGSSTAEAQNTYTHIHTLHPHLSYIIKLIPKMFICSF